MTCLGLDTSRDPPLSLMVQRAIYWFEELQPFTLFPFRSSSSGSSYASHSLNGRRKKKLKKESKRKLVQDTSLSSQLRFSVSSHTVGVWLAFKLPANSFPTALPQMFSSSSASPSSLAQNLSWPVLSVIASASSDSGVS